MEFNKTETLRNLKNLEQTIRNKYQSINGDPNINPQLIEEVKNDYYFVIDLMDDIECDRITEFPMVERTNIMSGKTFLEDKDTPHFCSPSSETYWSM